MRPRRRAGARVRDRKAALTYDKKGNLTADNRGHAYSWDFDNQLASATTAGKQTTYIYDALGRRLGKTVAGATTVLINAEEQVVAEYNGTTLARKYVYGDFVDRAIAMIVGSTTYYFTANTTYSVAALSSSTGAVVERYHYDAFGNRTVFLPNGSQSQTSSVGNPYGFTGRYHDSESGLVYFRTRYYDPTLGRFITRDKDPQFRSSSLVSHACRSRSRRSASEPSAKTS